MEDVIIIGGGPSGLTAGIYCARARLNVLLLEKTGLGGQAVLTDLIENYPGFPDGVSGFDLIENIKKQAEKSGLRIVYDEVANLEITGKNKFIKTPAQQYQAKSVIISTGASFRKLNILGETEFTGRGVSYCATCDGPFYRGKKVAVIGGGNSAVEEALFLTKFAEKVYLIHRRGQLRAVKILQERAIANSKIEIIYDSEATEILGKDRIDFIKIKNNKSLKELEIKLDGVFIFIGLVPNTGFLKNIFDLTADGFIRTNVSMQTSIPGVFACGDCIDKPLRQVITSAAEGAVAAFSAEKYIEKNYNGT